MQPSNKNPVTGGNRSRGDTTSLTSETYQIALAAYRSLRNDAGFDERFFEVYHADRFCAQHGITFPELLEIQRESRPKPDAGRFVWLEAVTIACGQGRISQKGMLVGVALFCCFNDRSPYAWPSQQTIASRAGWSGIRAVTYGLTQLTELGAIERVLARNLPVDVAASVLGAKAEGGSGRNLRSVAYKRVPPSEWQNVDTRTDRSTNNRNSSFHLNHKAKPKPLRGDSSNHSALTSDVEALDTFKGGHDVSELSAYEEAISHG